MASNNNKQQQQPYRIKFMNYFHISFVSRRFSRSSIDACLGFLIFRVFTDEIKDRRCPSKSLNTC